MSDGPPDYETEPVQVNVPGDQTTTIDINEAKDDSPTKSYPGLSEKAAEQESLLGDYSGATSPATYRADPPIKYDENMKPWGNTRAQYYFYCTSSYYIVAEKCCFCCEKIVSSGVKPGDSEMSVISRMNKRRERAVSFHTAWTNTVYHEKDSDRIVLKLEEFGTRMRLKNLGPFTKLLMLIFSIGLLMVIIGIATSGRKPEYEYSEETESGGGSGGVIGGGFALMIVAIVLFFLLRGGDTRTNAKDFITQSIPLASIYYCEREMIEVESDMKKYLGGQGCCAKDMPDRVDVAYSWIAIGWNNGKASQKIGNGSNDNYIRFRLLANQAYNLQQYMNGVLGGKFKTYKEPSYQLKL